MEQFESNRTGLQNGELFPKKNQQDFHTSSVRCSAQSQIIELVSITTLSSIVLFSQLIINHHVFASKINRSCSYLPLLLFLQQSHPSLAPPITLSHSSLPPPLHKTSTAIPPLFPSVPILSFISPIFSINLIDP